MKTSFLPYIKTKLFMRTLRHCQGLLGSTRQWHLARIAAGYLVVLQRQVHRVRWVNGIVLHRKEENRRASDTASSREESSYSPTCV